MFLAGITVAVLGAPGLPDRSGDRWLRRAAALIAVRSRDDCRSCPSSARGPHRRGLSRGTHHRRRHRPKPERMQTG